MILTKRRAVGMSLAIASGSAFVVAEGPQIDPATEAEVPSRRAGDYDHGKPDSSSDDLALNLYDLPEPVWNHGPGSGFRKGSFNLNFELGTGFGTKTFGTRLNHDLVISSIHLGWTVSDTVGESKWYRGSWELGADFFGGAQFKPETAYIVGLTPLVRYNFSTPKRWMPFLDLGAGVSSTNIGRPDLSTGFEFNIQTGAGLHWFFREKTAATFQYRWLHLSNGGIKSPNQGTNTSVFLLGLTWLF